MSLLKYIDRLKRMNDLIGRRATGSPRDFARKLNISRSQLLQDIKELRDLGAPVVYDPLRKSYYYSEKCKLILDFKENRSTT